MEFSGKTTCYDHTRGDWKLTPNAGSECIKDIKLFDVQWSNCPVEVEDEVKKLWMNFELGNHTSYFSWGWDDEDMLEDYPLIAEFLKSKGITEKDTILIHWWW